MVSYQHMSQHMIPLFFLIDKLRLRKCIYSIFLYKIAGNSVINHVASMCEHWAQTLVLKIFQLKAKDCPKAPYLCIFLNYKGYDFNLCTGKHYRI